MSGVSSFTFWFCQFCLWSRLSPACLRIHLAVFAAFDWNHVFIGHWNTANWIVPDAILLWIRIHSAGVYFLLYFQETVDWICHYNDRFHHLWTHVGTAMGIVEMLKNQKIIDLSDSDFHAIISMCEIFPVFSQLSWGISKLYKVGS